MKLKILIFIILIFNLTIISGMSSNIHIPEKYSTIEAGERFYFDISIKYPENPSRKDLRIEYEILDQNENSILKTKILKAIETQISFVDFLIIPENTKNGKYTLKVYIKDYEELNEEISTTFQVSNSFQDEFKIYFFILFGAIIFVVILIIISIILNKRN